jgi:hypothetical protein
MAKIPSPVGQPEMPIHRVADNQNTKIFAVLAGKKHKYTLKKRMKIAQPSRLFLSAGKTSSSEEIKKY